MFAAPSAPPLPAALWPRLAAEPKELRRPQDNYQKHAVEHSIRDSIDFMVERLDLIPREALASRLTLNMAPAYIEPQAIASQGIEVRQ